MARIVGSFMTSHVLMGDPKTDPQGQRVHEGMREIGRRIQALRPDVIVVISSDHMFNLNMALQPPFTIVTSAQMTPLGDMDLPRTPRPCHPALARAVVEAAAEADFDLAQAGVYRPDHGVAIPLFYADPTCSVPVLTLLVNINMDPPPKPRRCLALARVVADVVGQALPADTSVVVLGTGGLSHWINIPGHGQVNEVWDRRVIAALEAGDVEQLADHSANEILRDGGNGGLEIMNWIMAAGMLPKPRAELVYYEPMPQWMTGMGGMAAVAT